MRFAQRIQPLATWQDLVLPEREITILRTIALEVRQRAEVFMSWGLSPRGVGARGVNALFTGLPGTGKTLAAEVLGNELGLDLYRVDMSQAVSKYIGETEKNLQHVFDAAVEGHAILLFDEADVLIGKRTGVSDSHDRFENAEVSYLLQRMEAFHGLALLATNMKEHLDSAFIRRFQFVVQFPPPDASER